MTSLQQCIFKKKIRRGQFDDDLLKLQCAAGSWGELHGVDVALLIEVVEHLDPDVLRCKPHDLSDDLVLCRSLHHISLIIDFT